MDFDLTEEQRLLRDSVDRLLADNYTFEKRRGYLNEAEGWSRAMWSPNESEYRGAIPA